MKKDGLTNVLLKVTVFLLIVIVSLISFFGIYKRNLNSWENLLPEYNFSKELGETRTFSFVVDRSSKEVENSDENKEENTEDKSEESNTEEKPEGSEEGNTEEKPEEKPEENKEGNTEEKPKETVPVNDAAVLTKENYKKSKKIVEERLKKFGIIDSIVDVNEENGSLSVTVPYSDMTDYTVSLGSNQGKLEIIDTETKEILIPREMVTKATAYYKANSTNSGTYDLGVRLEFNSDGVKKLNELSKDYIETTDAEGNANRKTMTVRLNGEDRYTTYFVPNEQYTYLAVPLHQAITASDGNMEAFNDAYNNCLLTQVTLNSEELPIVYTVSAGTYFKTNLGENYVRNVIIAIAVILVVVAVLMVVKFKLNGLIMGVIQVGYIAIMLILVRAASVNIALAGLLMILFMGLANDILLCKLYNGDKFNKFMKFLLNMIPFIITILVFNFATDINIKSVGMIGVWGIFGFVYTFITSLLLLNCKNTRRNGVE